MAKILIPEYTFNAVTKKIVIPKELRTEQFLLITNVTRNEIIYSFADPTLGGTSVHSAVSYSSISITLTNASNVVVINTPNTIQKIASDWVITSAALPGGSASIISLDVASNKVYIDKLASSSTTTTGTITSQEPNRAQTELTLTFDTQAAGHNNADKLQIFVDQGETEEDQISFEDRFVDPVDKIRVSMPQSMIDTDFEYGTQPSRWETVARVLNYPSVFPKGVGFKTNTIEWQSYAPRDERGFNVLDIYSIQCGASSKIATVHCRSGHGLNVGDIVYIQGAPEPNILLNGHFFVQSITNVSFTIVTLGATNLNGGSATAALPAPGIGGSSNAYTNTQTFTFAAVDNSANRVGGSFITDGYRVGQILTVSGSRSGNNAKYLITSVTATKISLDTRNVVANETPSGYSVTLSAVAQVQSFGAYNSTELPGVSAVIGNGANQITVTTNVPHGLAVGQAIVVQNSNNAPANGTFFITSTPTTDSFTYTTLATTVSGNIFQYQIYVPISIPCTVTGNGTNSTVTITTISPAIHGFSSGQTVDLRIVNAPNFLASGIYTATATGDTTLTYPASGTISAGQFNCAVLVQAKGYVIHRPFDGGCQMGPNTTNASEEVIRQTRRYFRYQSGKGFQTSFGVRLNTPGGATSGHRIRAGHFDSQNGIFIEYDGAVTYFVRRNSTTQLSGTVAVTLGSQIVNGTGTTFTDPATGVGTIDANDPKFIVIRGKSYQVVKVISDSQIIITPAYRGSTELGNVVVSKTIDHKIPQSAWNLDKCDGTGPSGFNYTPTKMNMVYMDWHWYGAGNVRFGFKNKKGEIFYAHKMVHSNVINEAYFRSGNLPLRYHVLNGSQGASGGNPPVLFHWGTSAIMDGRFDEDRGYTFAFNNVQKTIGQIVVSGGGSGSTVFDPTDNSLTIGGTSDFTAVSYGAAEGSRTGPVQIGAVLVVTGASNNNNGLYQIVGVQNKKLFLAGKQVESQTVTNPGLNIGRLVALANIRLAPGVENSQAGPFGGRDLQNRMQLLPLAVDIINNAATTVEIRSNCTLVGQKWQPAGSGSLAQYDASSTDVVGGDVVFASSTPTPSNATAGSLQVTTFDLKTLRELNNSILGGDRTFPDGPDSYSFVIKSNPNIASTSCDITFRWAEQQS